jgi:anti-sigma regulatory factor (Ser/Thr protein kinase)
VYSALKGKKLLLDLHQVNRAFPDGAVPIAAMASELQKHKVEIDIIQPRLRDVDNLLHRTLFYHYVAPEKFSPPRFTTSRFPIYRFTSYEDQDKVVTQIVEVCSKELQFSSGMPNAFEWAINELAGNVIDHAQSNLGFAQVVSFSGNGNLNLVIADKGVGIFEALSAAHKTDDLNAIRLALQEGVTGKPGHNQGFGLNGASQIAKAAKGKLNISSGSGRILNLGVTPLIVVSEHHIGEQLLSWTCRCTLLLT